MAGHYFWSKRLSLNYKLFKLNVLTWCILWNFVSPLPPRLVGTCRLPHQELEKKEKRTKTKRVKLNTFEPILVPYSRPHEVKSTHISHVAVYITPKKKAVQTPHVSFWLLECDGKWSTSVNGTNNNCPGERNLMCFCFWGNMVHFWQFCFCSCTIRIAVVTFHLQLWHCICSFATYLYYSYVEICSCANEIAVVLMK